MLQLLLHGFEGGFGGFQLVAQGGYFGHDGGNVFSFALGFADLLGGGVAAGLQFLHAGLQRFALVLELAEGVGVQLVATGGQALGDGFRLAAKELNV